MIKSDIPIILLRFQTYVFRLKCGVDYPFQELCYSDVLQTFYNITITIKKIF